ncbi:MAG: AraC family transcriptional regulator [Arcobacter sp.]|nr:MAG: AraC family transcriptional regulator [Arcobacter sp.]
MKKETKQDRANIVNNSLFYIYKHIDSPISLDELARLNSVSKYHFHRIFKEETQTTLFETITSIRLQKAANLLIVNQYSTISEIINKCGFSSHSSFIKAFKKKFTYTPKDWRNGAYIEFSKQILKEYPRIKKIENLEPEIKPCEAIHCAYIRHKGYDSSIKKTWERLNALAYEFEIKDCRHIALQHDNPTITPLKEASYVACIEVPKGFKAISTFEIPKSLCAVFHLKGFKGDIINLMRYAYHFWLPTSGYESKTIPSYSIFNTNHFLNEDGRVDVDFYLPISVAY